jgi:hypothetical protein
MPIPTLAKPTGLQARDLYSMLISVPSAISSAGVITWTTGTEMAIASTGTGTWKAWELGRNPQMVSVMAGDMIVQNNQPEYVDWNVTIRELMLPTAQGVLEAAASFDYVRFDLIYGLRGNATGRRRIVGVGAGSNLREQQQLGENLIALDLVPIGWDLWFGAASGTPPI